MPLQRVFRILRERHPTTEPKIILKYAMKWLNDTMGPNVLVTSLLVSGTIPTLSMENKDFPVQEEQTTSLKTARDVIGKIREKQRTATAITNNAPP